MNRRDKKLESELIKVSGSSDVDDLFNLFVKYEQSNLKKIDKLTRERLVERNRIKGALKQTINAHGPIDMRLIGSATKRVCGALITNVEPKPKSNFNSFVWGVIVGSLLVLLIV
jgi:hypothetical protein